MDNVSHETYLNLSYQVWLEVAQADVGQFIVEPHPLVTEQTLSRDVEVALPQIR